MTRRLLLTAAAAVLLLTGCEPERECLRGHVNTTLMPITTCTKTCSVSFVPTTTYQCDEYAQELR